MAKIITVAREVVNKRIDAMLKDMMANFGFKEAAYGEEQEKQLKKIKEQLAELLEQFVIQNVVHQVQHSHKDLDHGKDYRDDYALFIERKHFVGAWKLDIDVGELTFFRVIEEGVEQRDHGWVEGRKVVQWG